MIFFRQFYIKLVIKICSTKVIKLDRNKKIIIVILLIILVILVLFVGYAWLNKNVEYRTIYLSNATTIEVPASDEANFVEDDLGIKYYQDPKYDVSIISWNSQEELSITGAVDVSAQFEKQKGGNTPTVEDGVPIYYNPDTGMFCIETGNDTTHDNILIMCKDKDIALKMYHSIKYGVSSINNDDGPTLTPTPTNTSQIDDSEDLDYDDYDYNDYDYDDDHSNSNHNNNPGTSDDSNPNVETTTG